MSSAAARGGGSSRAGATLVVYSLIDHPLRRTVADHLYAFRRYGRGPTVYLNLGVRSVPHRLPREGIDTVIFHTSFLGQRWVPEVFVEQIERARPLVGIGRARIAMPQDEFLRPALLCDFIAEFGIDHVFSVAPEPEWPKLYPGVDRGRVGFSQALTGYLAEDTVAEIERIVAARAGSGRPIDVGYRARPGAPWLGRHGMLKGALGQAFAREAPARGLVADISSADSDVLTGDDWFRFLADSKYTIGIEGGASVLDRDGSFKRATEAYLREHPDAGFEEVEAACFPGADGGLALFAISPRHLEACATRTCQVLVEGSYNGILRPGEHYLELRRDLSNLAQVLDAIERDDERAGITARAHRDVVASGRYGYQSFVREVESVAGAIAARRPRAAAVSPPSRAALLAASAADRVSWARVAVTGKQRPGLARAARRLLPRPLLDLLRRRLYGDAVAERLASDSEGTRR